MEDAMVATERVSVLSPIQLALTVMHAAKLLKTPLYDVAKHDMIVLVQEEVDRVMKLLSQRFSDTSMLGSLREGLNGIGNPLANKRGIVLLSYVSHPDFRPGKYAIGRTLDHEWFIVEEVEGPGESGKVKFRADDSTLMLAVVPGDFDSIKAFLSACSDTINDMFSRRIKALEKSRDGCNLDLITESFDQSMLPQVRQHLANLRR
jgi:hypothetical protein